MVVVNRRGAEDAENCGWFDKPISLLASLMNDRS
jgi:hypothetical protein